MEIVIKSVMAFRVSDSWMDRGVSNDYISSLQHFSTRLRNRDLEIVITRDGLRRVMA